MENEGPEEGVKDASPFKGESKTHAPVYAPTRKVSDHTKIAVACGDGNSGLGGATKSSSRDAKWNRSLFPSHLQYITKAECYPTAYGVPIFNGSTCNKYAS